MFRPAVRLAATIGFALALTACASSVSSFLPRGAGLRERRTYNWALIGAQPTGDPRLDSNRFFNERVEAAVDKELTKQGFAKAVHPDFLVHYHATVTDTIRFTSHERCDGEHDVGCPEVYERGTLLIDFVDAGDRLIWRGWADGAVDGVVNDQHSMEHIIDEAVTRIIRRLPPGF